jgi:WD40 repeat protein
MTSKWLILCALLIVSLAIGAASGFVVGHLQGRRAETRELAEANAAAQAAHDNLKAIQVERDALKKQLDAVIQERDAMRAEAKRRDHESSGKGKAPRDSVKGAPAHPDSKPPASKSRDLLRIESFLGLSSDFKAIAVAQGFLGSRGVKIVDLETRKNILSLKWDPDWGSTFSAAFSNEYIAIVVLKNNASAVKVFLRKTGELVQNVHTQGIGTVALTEDGRFLLMTEFRAGSHQLAIRDIQEKKSVGDLLLGGNGYSTLALARNRAAAHESASDQITVVQIETGKLLDRHKPTTFRTTTGFARTRRPLAISPTGNLIAYGADDDIILYDIERTEVAYKLEGHLDRVRALAFSPKGDILASAAKDKTIRFWNVKQRTEVHSIKDLPKTTSDLIFSTLFPDDNSSAELIFSTDGNKIAIVSPGPRRAEIRTVELK